MHDARARYQAMHDRDIPCTTSREGTAAAPHKNDEKKKNVVCHSPVRRMIHQDPEKRHEFGTNSMSRRTLDGSSASGRNVNGRTQKKG